ncbi:metalloregulator ArsR/SmtB family transcription factor [Massilia sp. TS11]|uniref:helix-turn-helix transcriptional regulator n=1 Tax=Massilia sp. TS11 TaxID=2908003 RepID=UPI001EDBDC2E|nr:metalloregulator ArsR/SmtB family transcription factor [Massilia sp. TS11]MCG2585924.1 transcriptional regulator [Massilia sp. TS11]
MSTFERILLHLKMRGAATAQEVGTAMGISSMGARRQLEQAEQAGLARHQDSAEGVGRPARRWSLTAAGDARFPDRHADLSLQLLEQLRAVFGAAGLQQLIDARERTAAAQYAAALAGAADLEERVGRLASLRAGEGYMAETRTDEDGSLLLLENHCPICAAARSCQDLCRSELALFQRVLGPGCTVERREHILAGARRCAYRIVPIGKV